MSVNESLCQSLISDINDSMQSLEDSVKWKSEGSKRFRTLWTSHQMQHSVQTQSDPSTKMYENSARVSYFAKWKQSK